MDLGSKFSTWKVKNDLNCTAYISYLAACKQIIQCFFLITEKTQSSNIYFILIVQS